MSIEYTNFITYFQNESSFYSDLPNEVCDQFNVWITNNFMSIGLFNSIEEVSPDIQSLKELQTQGYNHYASQCHYTAKAISILNPEYEFWTGFIQRESISYPIVTHSFNIKSNKIVDFSLLNEEFLPINSPDSFPRKYYGINIPREFVLKYKEQTLKEKSMNPLLILWYLEQNK